MADNKLKDQKTPTTLTTPQGGVRMGATGLHARVANAVNNPQPLCVANGFKAPPSFANFGKIMFFADVSGSMSSGSYDIGEANKLDQMKKAFAGYLDNCTAALNYVGIATFPEQTFEAPTQDYSLIRNLVSELEATGGTPLAAALNYVEQNIPATHGVVISDGQADEPKLALEIAKKYAAKLIKLDTVHIGTGAAGEDLLKQIAELTGGIYVKFTDTTNFAKTFEYLSPKKRGLLTSSKNPVALLGAAEVKL